MDFGGWRPASHTRSISAQGAVEDGGFLHVGIIPAALHEGKFYKGKSQ